MAILIAIFTLIGRDAAYGRSFALFLLIGIVMLNVVTRGSQMVMNAVVGLRKQNRLPAIGLFDEALSRVAFVVLVAMIYMPPVLLGIAVFSRVEVAPHHWDRVFEAAFLTAALAMGVGLLRGWSVIFFPLFERIYVIISRGLIFISGIFYMPSFLPPQLRDLLYFNPVVHAVEYMRWGFYREYPTTILDPLFLMGTALGTLAVGMALLWRGRGTVMG